jgi:phosphohistidine phosphatase
MSRTVILVRHAKTGDGEPDVDRALTPRGHADAAAIGRALAANDVTPDRVVVSPARRAQETWSDAARELPAGAAPAVVEDDRIYDNDEDLLLEIVRETPDDIDTLVLVGHNPSFGGLALRLGSPEVRRDGFPTAACAGFEITGSWAGFEPHAATPYWFVVARA